MNDFHQNFINSLVQFAPSRNLWEVKKWYRLVSEQNYALAPFQSCTSILFRQRRNEDYTQAHMWFNLARLDNLLHDEATKAIDLIAKDMKSVDISKAQEMIKPSSKFY